MKKIWLLVMFSLVNTIVFGQSVFFSSAPGDSLETRDDVRVKRDYVCQLLKNEYSVKPLIYHRIQKGDTLINYYRLIVSKKDSLTSPDAEIRFTYVQDSLFYFIGKEFPDFVLSGIDGSRYNLSSFTGRPIVINFWSVHCAPCIEEIPKLNDLKEKYGDQITFLAITNDQKIELSHFLKRTTFTWPVLMDDRESFRLVYKTGIPKNLFIDKYGRLKSIMWNYPYTVDDSTGVKLYSSDNTFTRIIEEMIHE